MMKITVDTNILVRAAIQDDPIQSQIARNLLSNASLIAVPLPCLCELVWVLKRIYKIDNTSISAAIQALACSTNVEVDHEGVDAGLSLLREGGDFADGIIAYEGRKLGGEVFVSFDQAAIKRLTLLGVNAASADSL
jgi:predicted nucleic-acid-binding protein